ncbi:MAG: DUF58 domain-containing protein [Deltaproteobacteria bacterium]|nr:DUF58 domain-containing protein [Deltaproteobacteria bacterium]MBW2382761.1 DUF58 domain-containing protein [Deltaproteobacteria bacterium]MBW2695741.1 DUF58 domain-containing protein [Deltaproteobacteria bacterium]
MLPKEIMRRVREIQVRTGRQVADVLAGEYVSVFRGSGIEFDEVRPYIPGDDVRSIDWNVTARMGEPFVKRYVEERQLTLMLLADVSASLDFGSGSRSKRECAAELCALLAFSASQNDDKVGLLLFHGGTERYIPPRKGYKHALRVVREVLTHGQEANDDRTRPRRIWPWSNRRRLRAPREGTDIDAAVEFLLSVNKRRAVCFVVSDFIDEDFERALRSANRKHDVIAVLVTDPREQEIPDVGLISLQDAETGAMRVVDAGRAAFRDAVDKHSRERITALRMRLLSAGIDLIHVDASGNVVDPLVRFFRARERRAGR